MGPCTPEFPRVTWCPQTTGSCAWCSHTKGLGISFSSVGVWMGNWGPDTPGPSRLCWAGAADPWAPGPPAGGQMDGRGLGPALSNLEEALCSPELPSARIV